MATTNLISKSLGDILMESGSGLPNHTSPKGSTYVDQDSGILYSNVDSVSGWTQYQKLSYANMSLTGNTTETTTAVANSWYNLESLSWSGGSENGVTYSASTSVLVIDDSRDGKYFISASAAFERVTSNAKYELGISKNAIPPEFNYYQGCSTDSTEANPSISVVGIYDLIAGDTIELCVRNILNTNNTLVTDAIITMFKINNT